METFSALLALCAGNSPVPGELSSQRPVARGFDVFFDQCLNKRLSKQPCGWWFETLSWSLWRHCNVFENRAPIDRQVNCNNFMSPWVIVRHSQPRLVCQADMSRLTSVSLQYLSDRQKNWYKIFMLNKHNYPYIIGWLLTAHRYGMS